MKITSMRVLFDSTVYTIDGTIDLAGDGWNNVSGQIRVHEVEVSHMLWGSGTSVTIMVTVRHSGREIIWNDSAFEAAIRKLLGIDVIFFQEGNSPGVVQMDYVEYC